MTRSRHHYERGGGALWGFSHGQSKRGPSGVSVKYWYLNCLKLFLTTLPLWDLSCSSHNYAINRTKFWFLLGFLLAGGQLCDSRWGQGLIPCLFMSFSSSARFRSFLLYLPLPGDPLGHWCEKPPECTHEVLFKPLSLQQAGLRFCRLRVFDRHLNRFLNRIKHLAQVKTPV